VTIVCVAIGVLGAIYLIALVIVASHFLYGLFHYQHLGIDKSIVQLGGILAVPAALVTAFVAIRQIQISRENQFTDLFIKSIALLAPTDGPDRNEATPLPNLGRLGGIYGLERVASASARDHWPIMEVLCRYVRQNSPRKMSSEPPANEPEARLIEWVRALPRPAIDVQAAMSAIGRRSPERIRLEEIKRQKLAEASRGAMEARSEKKTVENMQASINKDLDALDRAYRLDFRGANLQAMEFFGCNFSRGLFDDCRMEGVLFCRCDLSFADFKSSSLTGCIFIESNFDGAIFSESEMSNSQTTDSTFLKAKFYDIDLRNALFVNSSIDSAEFFRTDKGSALVIP
jgi:uncharacterized protein YjbI with pentapeptide repeats